MLKVNKKHLRALASSPIENPALILWNDGKVSVMGMDKFFMHKSKPHLKGSVIITMDVLRSMAGGSFYAVTDTQFTDMANEINAEYNKRMPK